LDASSLDSRHEIGTTRTTELIVTADEDDLRDQEVALGKLGALYRDHE
jgi:hypothetical protein